MKSTKVRHPDSQNGKPVLLVTHGSFNPVHAGHVQMMVRAREALEAAGRRVVGGEMAITCQRRIESKGSAAMGDELRLALLRLALQPHASWLAATDGTWHHSAVRVIADSQSRYDAGHGEAVEAWSIEGGAACQRALARSSPGLQPGGRPACPGLPPGSVGDTYAA